MQSPNPAHPLKMYFTLSNCFVYVHTCITHACVTVHQSVAWEGYLFSPSVCRGKLNSGYWLWQQVLLSAEPPTCPFFPLTLTFAFTPLLLLCAAAHLTPGLPLLSLPQVSSVTWFSALPPMCWDHRHGQPLLLFVFFFETESLSVGLASLDFTETCLPLFPKRWN